MLLAATSTPTSIREGIVASKWQQWLRKEATMSLCTYTVHLVYSLGVVVRLSVVLRPVTG